MAYLERGQLFGVGITLGILLGFVLGSVLAMWLGSEAIEAVHRLVDRATGRGEQVHFELLLQ